MVVNLENVFKFPFKDKKWFVKILLGLIPIVNLGYLLRILADAIGKREPVLPEWGDWGKLLQDGFMALIVIVCYFVIFIPLFILGMIPIIGFLFKTIALFLLGPVCVTALCFYLERKELTAAFDFKGIIEKFRNNITDYLIVALIASAVGAVFSIPTFLSLLFLGAAFVPPNLAIIFIAFIFFIVALLVSALAWFYLHIVVFRLYGEVFSVKKSS